MRKNARGTTEAARVRLGSAEAFQQQVEVIVEQLLSGELAAEEGGRAIRGLNLLLRQAELMGRAGLASPIIGGVPARQTA